MDKSPLENRVELSEIEITSRIEKIVKPITSSGIGVHAINGMGYLGQNWQELLSTAGQILQYGLLSKRGVTEWRNHQMEIRKSQNKDHIAKNFVYFNIVGYDTTSVKDSFYSRKNDIPNIFFILDLDDLLQTIEPGDRDSSNNPKRQVIYSNSGIIRSKRDDENTLIANRHIPIPYADNGYRIISRIRPTRLIGLALADSCLQTDECISDLKKLFLKTKRHLPIYSTNGDLIYPYECTLEQIKAKFPDRYKEYPRYS